MLKRMVMKYDSAEEVERKHLSTTTTTTTTVLSRIASIATTRTHIAPPGRPKVTESNNLIAFTHGNNSWK